jgi:diguanylate cyclase (GGDEF)-like protein
MYSDATTGGIGDPVHGPEILRLLFVHRDPALAERVRGLLCGGRPAAVGPEYRVAHFTHLQDSLTYLKISPVDLVLVGPEPAGTSLVEAVRRIGAAHPETPVVALLDSPSGDDIAAARAAGAREVLPADEFSREIWTRTFDFCQREMAVSRELAEVTARLDWLHHMDALTDLLNRKGMERAVLDELARCRCDSGELLVLLIDLDEFSRINATLGHGVGDLVLTAAAKRITESVGEKDKAGRLGTDRFVVVLCESELAEAEVLAEKIRLAISRDVITAGEHQITTTASIGIAQISPDSLSFDEVLAKAHFVLQQSKLRGKNRVGRAATLAGGEMVTPAVAGPEIVETLLRGEGIRISSQPIVNLTDGRIVSREMLSRGPEGPLHRPDNLFRFCQENDILTAVDLKCLLLCAEAAVEMGPRADYHVNIMPATLLQTDPDELIRVLKLPGGEGRCCLEISEQQLLGDPTALVPAVRRVQEAGIRVAVDDVGFGNSCLEGLIMLHPQVMKIDKRLVCGLAVDPEMRRAMSRLLKVAEVLGAEVVAEGIENTEDYHILLDMGVKLGQGYLFGRPVPCAEDPSLRGRKNGSASGARA